MSEWKKTDFGRIPTAWDLKRITDIKANDKRAIAMGPFGSNIKAENFVELGVPVIRGTNLNSYKYVDGEFVFLTEEKANELNGSECLPGDLVFTHRGTIGQVGLIPSDKYSKYIVSQSGMKLTVDSTIIDNEFLFYFFKSQYGQHQLLKYESQVGVPSLSNPLTSLKEIEVPVPTLSEQKRITKTLSSVDDKINLLQRQNKTLKALAETLFKQWFVEEIDDSWEETTLNEIAIFNNGKARPNEINKGQVPIYGGNGILGYTNTSNYQDTSIIIGRVGAYCGSLYIEDKPIWLSDNALLTRSKTENDFYLFYLLKTLDLNSLAEGSSHPLLTQTLLKSIKFILPSKHKISMFNNHAKAFWNKIFKNQVQIKTITQLRDTLLPKLMSGEVRVAE